MEWLGLHLWTIWLPYFTSTDGSCNSGKENIKVISYDQRNLERKCRRLVERKNGKIVLAEQLKIYLELIFGQKVVKKITIEFCY